MLRRSKKWAGSILIAASLLLTSSLGSVFAQGSADGNPIVYYYDGKTYTATPIEAEPSAQFKEGQSLSASEVQAASLQNDLANVQEWVKANNADIFGGAYIDEDGTNVVTLTKESSSTDRGIASISSFPDKITIKYVKYTEAQNVEVKQHLLKLAEDGQIQLGAVGINPKLNKVNVYLSKDQLAESKDQITQLAADDQVNFIIEDVKVVEQATVTPGGEITYTSGSSTYACTAAFHAVRSNTDVFFTAGHCGGVGTSYKVGSTTVGTVVAARNSTTTKEDAAAASLGSNGTRTVSVRGTTLTIGTFDYNGARQTVGSAIRFSGRSGNYNSVTVVDNAYSVPGSNYDMIRTSVANTQGGDSGGLWYSIITKNNKNFAVIEGIHKGILQDANGNNLGAVFSKLSNVYDDMGISSIYIDSTYPG
ncbi:hypothetical protein [Paenibacillus sp. NPDC058071]|uniref:hypothetical protein n=1 Tax=Paenibacillus sp. NPDC058071 TaxID=3346326 RepID=UPI0036DD1C0F